MGARRIRAGARAAAVGAALVLLASCGGDGGHEHEVAAQPDGHDHTHGEAPAAATYGAPGDPDAATRTIEVAAGDPFKFKPDKLELKPGETVTFVVSNEGDQVHEFVLGDRDYQESHEEAMAAGAMHHDGNAVTVGPGETQKLTWTFPRKGEVLYGCHVQGHYEAGMVGAIRISA